MLSLNYLVTRCFIDLYRLQSTWSRLNSSGVPLILIPIQPHEQYSANARQEMKYIQSLSTGSAFTVKPLQSVYWTSYNENEFCIPYSHGTFNWWAPVNVNADKTYISDS